jgi:hypothetical protein
MARKLRIAVSVFFGLLTVALIILWARSRNAIDVFGFRPTAHCWIAVSSSVGELECTILSGGPFGADSEWFGFESFGLPLVSGTNAVPLRPRFSWQQTPNELRIVAPTLALALVLAVASAVPWIPRPSPRFSLRTLLIATTLLAIILGLGVWLAS